MAVPVCPTAAQSTDTGSRSLEIASQGNSPLKQNGSAGEKQGVNSFLRFLQGAAKDTKGGSETGQEEQASASLRLLALLFQLDPAQLANLAGNAAMSPGSEGGAGQAEESSRLLSMLQDSAGNGQGLKALFRILSAGGSSRSPELLADLREILGQTQGSGNGQKSASQESGALQSILHQTEVQGQGKAGSGGQAERILQLLLSGESRANASSKGGDMSQLLSALHKALEQGRLSGEQLQAFARDLSSMTAENTSQPKTAAQTGGPGGLAALLQQAKGGEGQSARPGATGEQGDAGKGRSGVHLARLFLESFDRGEQSGRNKGQGTSPAQGGHNFLQQDKSLLQSLVEQGQARIQKADAPSAQSSGASHSGVSLKAGQWGGLLTSVGGASTTSPPGSLSHASQPSGPSSMMDNQVLQQVVSKFQTELQRGSRRVNIRMHPPELGRVQLKLVSEDSTMQVQLQVQNSQVQGILERNMPALRQALEQQNLDFESIQVSVDSGGEEGSRGYSRQSDSDAPRDPGWLGSGEAGAGDTGGEIPAAGSGEAGGISLRV